ncbi:prepilin-type N-terminal cleavage/methylation domain-containing protein [Pseudomonas sp. RW3S2]|uniref:PilW family protein n=1 Tax=Pseudomonas sp. RW3S2 TaxID=485884 RepID=UPI001646E221|nr:prepilin-type N-terminal cleavage/methylation domain-containing protein [Pseudomonas sp. RW3S2]MBC3423285.1 prepilin-type N-terminal cleavage/methylation domain-containing protein [Pseudomonas sp. RW3S2]
MMSRQQGFGLLEALLALALGLMLLAAAGQALVSAQQAWRMQGALSRMQDDASLALHRLAQDIRMTGMFGCLAAETLEFIDPSAAQAFAQPLQISHAGNGREATLSLVSADVPGAGGNPDWTLLTDCLAWAQVHPARQPGSGTTLAFPLRRQTYRFQGDSLMLSGGGMNAVLIDNVRAFRATRVVGNDGERVDLQLTLVDPVLGIERDYALSVALRNRLPPS